MEHWALSLPDADATPETASGPLEEYEQRQLAEAHRAIDNARTARWMLGYALEVVRRRRLYRGDGARTWEQYLTQEHDGMSTSEADRLQKTWRLAQALQKELGRPLPDSHLRQLQPYAERTSDEEAARAYAALFWAHQKTGVRLVAEQVHQRVRRAVAAAKGVSDPAERAHAVSAAWTVTPADGVPDKGGDGRSADPVDAAIKALERAKRAIEAATADVSVTRSSKDARRQQAAIRSVGRWLTKVEIDEGVVEAELIND